MKSKRILVAVAAVVVVAAIVGIVSMSGKSGTQPRQPASAAATATNAVNIKDYMFAPVSIRVKVDTTVTWTNTDHVNHTVTSDTNSTDAPSSMDIAHGASYSFTFRKAGMYTYHCFPHPYMHGTVEVTKS